MKILEKPGTVLINLFGKQFNMSNGCSRGEFCVCNKKGNCCRRKRVVYEAVCSTCPKELAPKYIGETARQFGTRAVEHLTNLQLLKKESFMTHHWMDCHPLMTTPPDFKFKILSQHKDALSRQIREAVCIKEWGTMNRKNEFALNELIQLESSCYSWDKASQDKKDKHSEVERDIKLNDFVNVMKKVTNLNVVPNVDICNYRLKFQKRKVKEAQRCTKRPRMNSSTPLAYRSLAQVTSSPETSPISTMENKDMSEDDIICGRNFQDRHYENKLPEPLIERIAKEVVTIHSFNEAEDYYKGRMAKDPIQKEINDIANLPWEEDEKFKMNNSDSRSFDILDLIDCEQDMGLARLFEQKEIKVPEPEKTPGAVEVEFIRATDKGITSYNTRPLVVSKETSFITWRGEKEVDQDTEDYGLTWLFGEEETDYGLDWLFSDEDNAFEDRLIDKMALVRAVVAKRRNSLPDIFKRMDKRKRSPVELTNSMLTKKFKMMSVASDSSPKLRTPKKSIRVRSCISKSSRSVKGKQKLDPKQALLTQFLNIGQSQEDKVE